MKKIVILNGGILIILIVLSQNCWARQTQLESYTQAQKLNEEVIKLYAEGRYAEAIPLAEQALAILEKAMGTKHSSVITARSNLRKLYQMIGEDPKASRLYEQTIENQEKTTESNHRVIAQRLNAQGLQLLHSERAIKDPLGTMFFAESLFKEALSIQEQELGRDDPDIAITLNNLAEINLLEAKPLYQRALEIQEKALGSEHPLVAATLSNFAMSYRKLYSGNPLSAYGYAAPLYQRALAIQENVLGPEHPEIAETLDNLAALSFEVYLELMSSHGDQDLDEQTDKKNREDSDQLEAYFFNEALSLYKRSQQSYAQFVEQTLAFTPEEQQRNFLATVTWQLHRFLSLISQNLSQNPAASKDALDVWLRRKGVTLEAQKGFQDVRFKSDDPQAVQLAQEFNKVRAEETRLAYIKPDKIEPDSHKHQVAELNARKNALEAQRIRLSLPYAVSREVANVDTAKVAKMLQDQASFQLTEQSLKNLRNENIPEDLLDKLNPIVNQIIKDEKEFLDAIEKYIGKERTIQYKSLILKHAQTYPVLLEFAKVDMFDYTDVKDSRIEEMFNIEVLYTNEKRWQPQPAHYLVFILHAGNGEDVRMIDLGDADEIDRAITRFKTPLRLRPGKRGVEHSLQEPDVTLPDLAQKVYDLVFAPLKEELEELGDTTEIFISPDDNLNLIPFEVLVDPDGKYLIETYTFNYLAAGRDILGFGEKQEKGNTPLLMGDPDFDFSIEPGDGDNRRSADMRNLFPFGRLEKTKAEVEEIHKLLGKNASTLYTGKKAREDILLKTESPRILHLATHGFFLEDQDFREFIHDDSQGKTIWPSPQPAQNVSPTLHAPFQFENPLLRSGIALAGANKVRDNTGHSQGIVTAEKILGLKLRGTDLVVLSACETGLGEVQTGEGVYGLRRAFLQAGTKSLVMSLWSVDDPATKELMVRFYQKVLPEKKNRKVLPEKKNRAQALREAALEVKNLPEYADPYYWGAFVFLGEP